MSLPSQSLDDAARELQNNLFQDVLDGMGAKADIGGEPSDPPTLK